MEVNGYRLQARGNLAGANLEGADLTGISLSGADLRGADLTNADLSGTDFRGANLAGANLEGADLRGSNLMEADLSQADLTLSPSAEVHIVKLESYEWQLAKWLDPYKSHAWGANPADFPDPRDRALNNFGSLGPWARLLIHRFAVSAGWIQHEDGEWHYVESYDDEWKFIGRDLHLPERMVADQAVCTEARFSGAKMRDSCLTGTDLLGATLTDANLTVSSFIGANFQNANLRNANFDDIATSEETLWSKGTVWPDAWLQQREEATRQKAQAEKSSRGRFVEKSKAVESLQRRKKFAAGKTDKRKSPPSSWRLSEDTPQKPPLTLPYAASRRNKKKRSIDEFFPITHGESPRDQSEVIEKVEPQPPESTNRDDQAAAQFEVEKTKQKEFIEARDEHSKKKRRGRRVRKRSNASGNTDEFASVVYGHRPRSRPEMPVKAEYCPSCETLITPIGHCQCR